MTGLAKTVKRSWPYIAATLLCIAVIVLMCVACATDWYEADGEGQIKVQRNETYPKLFEYLPLSWSIKEDLFSLTLEIGSSSVTCDYKDGKCDAARDLVRAYYNAGAWTTDTCQTPPCYNRPWDVSEYEGAYIGILFFSILSMLLALAVAVLSQLVYWKAMDWERTARGLSIANVVISALLIVSLFITWGILWHHPKMAQGSLDYHSCDEDFEDEENGSFLCSWMGDINVGKQVSRQTEWSGFYWLDYSEEWGPSTAWTLTTVALGLAMASLTLVVGWKPAFES